MRDVRIKSLNVKAGQKGASGEVEILQAVDDISRVLDIGLGLCSMRLQQGINVSRCTAGGTPRARDDRSDLQGVFVHLWKKVNHLGVRVVRESQTVIDTGIYNLVIEAASQVSVVVLYDGWCRIVCEKGVRLFVPQVLPSQFGIVGNVHHYNCITLVGLRNNYIRVRLERLESFP